MAKKLLEIRWHARGGQGAKTAAGLVAKVAVEEGKFSQGSPEYGPERTGAPIQAYTRISDAEIRIHSGIDQPDVVVVLDATLLDTVNVCDGIVPGGIILVNTKDDPAKVRPKLKADDVRVMTIDATQISLDEVRAPFPNTPMMGALVKATGAIKLESLFADVEKKFRRKGPAIVEGNIRALKRAYDEVKA
jgi:pyruvate ferredoxin oxidoreductase gamma subunit